MTGMTIGKIAKRAEVGVETIRFYERVGLIQTPPRKASGYRQFPPETVQRIRFIRRAKELGFTLKEIRNLLELRTRPGQSCDDVQTRALEKITDIDQRITSLKRMRSSLENLVHACKTSRDSGQCPILDSLEGESS